MEAGEDDGLDAESGRRAPRRLQRPPRDDDEQGAGGDELTESLSGAGDRHGLIVEQRPVQVAGEQQRLARAPDASVHPPGQVRPPADGSSTVKRAPPPGASPTAIDPALGLHERAADGEAEPGAGSPARDLRPVEAVEDERQVGGVHAGAVVGHREAHRRARRAGEGAAMAGRSFARVGACPDRDRHVPAGRRELERVVEQIGDHLQQAVAVAQHHRRPQVLGQLDSLGQERRAVPVGGAGGDVRQVHRLVLDTQVLALQLIETAQRTEQAPEPLDFLADHAQVLGGRRQDAVLERLHPRLDRRQRSAQLVREVTGHVAAPLLVAREAVGHGVERGRQRRDLIVAARRNAYVQVAGRDVAGRVGELLQGAGDAPAHEQTDEQRQHPGDRGGDEQVARERTLVRVLGGGTRTLGRVDLRLRRLLAVDHDRRALNGEVGAAERRRLRRRGAVRGAGPTAHHALAAHHAGAHVPSLDGETGAVRPCRTRPHRHC